MPATSASTLLIQPKHREPWGAYARELWRYRELLFIFTWRDLKLRYKQTALGVAWVILQPLASILVFTIFFGKLAHLPSENVPYPLFAFVGFLPWTFFANAVNRGSLSLVSSQALVSKIYFPRVLLPASAVAAGLVDYFLGLGVLAVLMAVFRVAPSPLALAALPGLTLLLSLCVLAATLWLSALNVRYRDVTHLLPFFLQLWMFATPIVYPVSLVPERFRWLAGLNPLCGIIEAYRAAIFGRACDLSALGSSSLVIACTLIGGLLYFQRMERSFADII